MIELKDVCFSYGDKQILKDFNLKLSGGEAVCLNGPSGCGKTTVIRLITGLEKTVSGTVIAPKKISCVFQEDRLLSHLTAYQNVILPLKKSEYKNAERLLTELGLGDFAGKFPKSLSGGMKRRVAIARAVAFGGDAILLDEAFNGIDEENKTIAAEIIKREFLQKGKPVLMISHITEDAQLFDSTNVYLKKI